MTESFALAQFDFDRPRRTGLAEAIFCEPKPAEVIEAILAGIDLSQRRILLTRLEAAKAARISVNGAFDYDPVSQTAFAGTDNSTPQGKGGARVIVVTGGTADLPVAREAIRTLEFHHASAQLINDVGVAGLWRLMNRLDELAQADLIIACAGMEAALPTVLAGLVSAPLIAVPVSCGYGVSAGGTVALNSLLASCGPGIAVTNIDNGFGAACVALRILHRILPNHASASTD